MRPARLALFAALALAAALAVGAALFPLSLALRLAGAPVTGTPSGTVWNGRIEDAAVQGQPLGLVTLRPRLFPLLGGTLDADVTMDGPLGTGEARVKAKGQRVILLDAAADLDLAATSARDAFGQPLRGRAQVETPSLTLAGGACEAGTLDVTTDLLTQAAAQLGAPALGAPLAGQGACEDGMLVLPLTGRGAAGEAEALLRLGPARYTTALTLTPDDPRAGQVLEAYGFKRSAGGFTLVTRGRY